MTTITPCRDRTAVWYSDDRRDQATAKEGCQRCPLVARCLLAALRRRERFGVWGSFTTDEREALLSAVRRRVAGGT